MSFLNLMRNKLKPKEVNDALSEVSGDVSDLETAVATINGTITNTITPRLPKDYSTTETATGQKWIDGKEVYKRVFHGNVVTGTHTYSLMPLNGEYIINISNTLYVAGVLTRSDYGRTVENNGTLEFVRTSAGDGEGTYNVIMYYTKPDPEPEPGPTTTTKRNKNK